MSFLIADTFTDSLSRLTSDEQKAVKTTAFDLQMNLASPGLSFHKLAKAKDKNFWSVRVSGDIRLIVHKTEDSLLLCYVNRHDKAYDWAERRRLETHPKTGAAQLVEIRETVKEVVVPVYVQTEMPAPTKPPLFADKSDEELLGYGVPAEWLSDVRQATEDSLFPPLLNMLVPKPAPGSQRLRCLLCHTHLLYGRYSIAGAPPRKDGFAGRSQSKRSSQYGCGRIGTYYDACCRAFRPDFAYSFTFDALAPFSGMSTHITRAALSVFFTFVPKSEIPGLETAIQNSGKVRISAGRGCAG